jgi:hypothetical protein
VQRRASSTSTLSQFEEARDPHPGLTDDGAASLSVLKGNTYLRVAVSPAGAAPSLSDEEQLATAILPKL